MKFRRAILALLIAVSVATLPAAGGMTQSVESTGMSQSDSMVDRDRPVEPCHKPKDDCQSMTGCALKCFNYLASFLIVPLPLVLTDRALAFADGRFHPQPCSPLLRPPRA
jgi:hypothetical protein